MSQSLRLLGVAALASVGVFVTMACLLALNFEVSGFGRPTDTPTRTTYVTALVAGAIAGVLAPAGAAWLLLGAAGRTATAVVGGVSLVVLIALLGVRIF